MKTDKNKRNKSEYNRRFFEEQYKDASLSMKGIVGCVAHHYHGNISSAIDVGCGLGILLSTFRDFFGAKTKGSSCFLVRGLDGDYVQRDMMAIHEDEFIEWDLEKPYSDCKKYDIAISTEVVEHLYPSRADGFVDDLVKLSDLILFSAAVPYQGGVHHVNEQPLSYWVKKFEERGFEFRDIIRPDIWDNADIATCYRKNLVMFVKVGTDSYENLDKYADKALIDVIHPDHWKWKNILLQGRLGRIYMKIEHVMIKVRNIKRNHGVE